MLSFSFAVECTPSSNSRKRQIMIWQQNGDYKISIAAEHSDRFICLYIHAFYNECVYTQYVYMHGIEYILRTSHSQRDTLRIFRPVCIFLFLAAAQSHSPFPSLSHFLLKRRYRSVSLFILYFIWFAHVQLQ